MDGGDHENMKKIITVFNFCTMLFALCVSAEAQQPKKIPRIGYVSGADDLKNPGLRRHSAKGCETSVISREKTSWLNIATSREIRIGSQAS
jgi:hypothetical protein